MQICLSPISLYGRCSKGKAKENTCYTITYCPSSLSLCHVPHCLHKILLETGRCMFMFQIDDSIYVVQSGKLCVSVVEKVSIEDTKPIIVRLLSEGCSNICSNLFSAVWTWRELLTEKLEKFQCWVFTKLSAFFTNASVCNLKLYFYVFAITTELKPSDRQVLLFLFCIFWSPW